MKHRRGIDLGAPFAPASFYPCEGAHDETLDGLQEWEVIGARCGKCGRVTWLDKRAMMQLWGNQYLKDISPKLTCACGNKDGNTVLIGTLPR